MTAALASAFKIDRDSPVNVLTEEGFQKLWVLPRYLYLAKDFSPVQDTL